MKTSYKVALGGMIMALSVLCMTATNLFPIASFALPAIAGCLIIPVNLELGKKWALCVYIGVALLSIFISSDHTAIISFIVLFGYYPILKGVIERIRKPIIEWFLKMLVFNVAVGVGVLLTLVFFGLDVLIAEYSGFGKLGIIAFWAVCNVVFVVFDIALTRMITLIIYRFLPLFKRFK